MNIKLLGRDVSLKTHLVLLQLWRFARLSVVAAVAQVVALGWPLTLKQCLLALAVGAAEVFYRQVVPVVSRPEFQGWVRAAFRHGVLAQQPAVQKAIEQVVAAPVDTGALDAPPLVNGQPPLGYVNGKPCYSRTADGLPVL